MRQSFATTSIFLDSYHPKTDGSCAVSIRVTYDRKKRYYPTGKRLTPKEFEKAMSEKPGQALKETAIAIHNLESKAAGVIAKLPLFTWAAFEKGFLTNRSAKDTLSQAFDDYASQLRKEERIGTAETYECAKKSLDKFSPGARFVDVNPDFLRQYEKWMLGQENSITTVGIYLRSLRTLFNQAVADSLLSKELYPFGKNRYEIPTATNVKKALTLNDISKIYYYQAEPGSSQEMAKDYWLFMYLCNGMNMKDMCLLKYSNIKGDILEFQRAKSKRTKRKVEPIRVVITDDVKSIIEKYGNKDKSPTNYIFPTLTPDLSAERQRDLIKLITHVVNEHVKAIAIKLEIPGSVTTYFARHSFATILQRSGAGTEFISEALGHSNVKTTQNYLAGFEDETKKKHILALTAFKSSKPDH